MSNGRDSAHWLLSLLVGHWSTAISVEELSGS
jgi:hypothetical protein